MTCSFRGFATTALAAVLTCGSVAAIDAAPGKLVLGPALPATAATDSLAPVVFQLDDGTAENSIGDVGQFMWLNRFTPVPSDFPIRLDTVQVVFGDNAVPLGGAVEVLIYEDTDGDGDPGTGSNLVATFNGVVQANDGATLSTYALVPAPVLSGPGDILVGVVNRYGAEGTNDFPATLDQTASQVRSWAASWLAGDVPANPSLPADEQWGTIDSFGFPGNWLVRALGESNVPVELFEFEVE